MAKESEISKALASVQSDKARWFGVCRSRGVPSSPINVYAILPKVTMQLECRLRAIYRQHFALAPHLIWMFICSLACFPTNLEPTWCDCHRIPPKTPPLMCIPCSRCCRSFFSPCFPNSFFPRPWLENVCARSDFFALLLRIAFQANAKLSRWCFFGYENQYISKEKEANQSAVSILSNIWMWDRTHGRGEWNKGN